jgi:NADPH-dependent glutamate synthase beta subunit-like oxidoreductase
VSKRTGVGSARNRTGAPARRGLPAVFLGIGAWKDSKLAVPGEELNGCFTGIDFLSRLASGEKLDIKPVAAVIGGGNTAIDCTRNLLRLGARKVHLVYRRTRKEMPANPVEVEAAEAEGVELMFLSAPVRVIGDNQGNVTHLEYLRMELGEPDASGRRRPVPVEGSETLLPTDMVISAIGQAPDVASPPAPSGKPPAGARSTPTLRRNLPLYAGMPATASWWTPSGGRQAARSIHQYVMGQPVAAADNSAGRSSRERSSTARASLPFAREMVDGIGQLPVSRPGASRQRPRQATTVFTA